MIIASLFALATLSAPASPLLVAQGAAIVRAPVCQGAPGRPALCRPAEATRPSAARSIASPPESLGARVAVVACHPDPGKNRGCFRRVAIGGETALAAMASVRKDGR